MKIVGTFNANRYIEGVVASLFGIKQEVYYWNRQQKPAFDLIDEVAPDVLICESVELDPSLIAALKESPDTKVIVVGLFAPSNVNVALMVYPSFLKDEQIARVNKNNLPFVMEKKAANLAKFCNGVPSEKDSSDIFFLSDINFTENPDVLKELSKVDLKYRLRCIGPYRLPIPSYCGNANLPNICNIMKSTKVALDIGDEHKFDYAINKIAHASTAEEAQLLVDQPKLRAKRVKEAYKEAKKDKTYFHIIAEIFTKLQYNSVADDALAMLEKILND